MRLVKNFPSTTLPNLKGFSAISLNYHYDIIHCKLFHCEKIRNEKNETNLVGLNNFHKLQIEKSLTTQWFTSIRNTRNGMRIPGKIINMQIKKLLTGFLIVILFSGCEKSENLLDLKGTLKGRIYTLDEFGYQVSDNENILIQLEGSEPLISSVTDSTGRYEIKDIPTGTYNLIISKEGYGSNIRQGFQIVGGNEPLYLIGSIIEKSSTLIENLSLEILNDSEIYLKGIVNHNYIIAEWDFNKPTIRYFIHDENNPSGDNYVETFWLRFEGDSGSQLFSRIYIDNKRFPSGSKIYIIAYGYYYFDWGYFDILANQLKYTTLGKGSNIASIIIP